MKKYLLPLVIIILMNSTISHGQSLQRGMFSPNNTVWDITADESSFYIAGDFNFLGFPISKGAFISMDNNQFDPAFPQFNGDVLCSVSDNNGGIFVGGYFTLADLNQSSFIAHIDGDGNVLPFFPKPNGAVLAIAVGETFVYIGGTFTQVGSHPIKRLARIYLSTGLVDDTWNMDVDNAVLDLELDSNYLYVAGAFSEIDSMSVKKIVRIDLTGDSVDANWMPNIVSTVNDIALSDNYIYAGGRFSAVGGAASKYVCRIEKESGNIDWKWTPQANDNVYTIFLKDSSLFIGGDFTQINGKDIKYLAKLDMNGDVSETFNMNLDGSVNTINFLDSYLYIGGNFTSVNGLPHSRIAKIDYTNTQPDSSFTTNFGGGVNTINFLENHLFAGGHFEFANGVERNHIAKFSKNSNEPLEDFNVSTDRSVTSITVDGQYLYLAGVFTTVNDYPLPYLARVNKNTGIPDTNWLPKPKDFVGKIDVVENSLLAVGSFDSTATLSNYTQLVKISLEDGSIDPSFKVLTFGSIHCFARDNTDLFIGGDFSLINDYGKAKLAKVNFYTGEVDTTWGTNIDQFVKDLEIIDNSLFIAGGFQYVGNIYQPLIAKLYLDNGNINSNWSNAVSGIAYDLVMYNDNIHLAGNFISANGEPATDFLGFDIDSGFVYSENQFNTDGSILKVYNDSDVLLLGGSFNYMSSVYHPNFVKFNKTAVSVDEGFSSKPDKFKLYQNYPNPFNPTTTITYSIPMLETHPDLSGASPTNVNLMVYDILGREVATLVNQKQAPGNYSVRFNASKLSSGIYFYTLKTGSFVITKKMLLLK